MALCLLAPPRKYQSLLCDRVGPGRTHPESKLRNVLKSDYPLTGILARPRLVSFVVASNSLLIYLWQEVIAICIPLFLNE